MTKLNQIIAIEKGAKNAANDTITAAYHKIQKVDLFSGIARTYEKKDDEGDDFPAESTLVQINAEQLLKDTAKQWGRLLDVTATKDASNSVATADVVVDGTTVLSNVPVTYLIWLEKQLVDLKTFVSRLPVLDPAFEWEPAPNAGAGVYATAPVKTHKSKKVLRNHVKAEATDKHPAQVETYSEDIVVGYWNTIRYSGALPQAEVDKLSAKVVALQEAVKFAREQANSVEVVDVKVGDPIFNFLLN